MWNWVTNAEDDESVDEQELALIARRASCSLLPDELKPIAVGISLTVMSKGRI